MEIKTLDTISARSDSGVLAQAIAAAPSVAVVMMGPDGLITFWNQGAENIFGWTGEEIIGRNLHEILAPERYHAAHRKAFPHFLNTGQGGATGKTLDLTGLHRDGHEVHIQLSLSAVQLEAGWGAVGIIHDITERMEMENDLILERLQLFALFDGMVDSVYVIDPTDHKVLYMNKTAAGYWGNGVGRKCFEVIHKRDKPCSFCNHENLFGDNIGTNCIRERKNQANGHWFRCVDRGLRLSDGRDVRLEIAYDITERKNEELAMARALDEAQQANLAKSHFLANVSHELRTPLNGMIGMLGLLHDTSLNEEQKDFVDTAAESSSALLKVVEDLLDFSSIETGEMALDLETFAPRSILNKALEPFIDQADGKGVIFEVQVDPDIPFVLRGYPNRLGKVYRNIVGNALKFTSEGSISVRLAMENTNEGQATVRCTVTDTGIGIDGEKLDEIFSTFSQADTSFSRKFGGLGLGLSLAQRLVNSMSGRIGVESDGPGRGSTFWFTARFDLVS